MEWNKEKYIQWPPKEKHTTQGIRNPTRMLILFNNHQANSQTYTTSIGQSWQQPKRIPNRSGSKSIYTLDGSRAKPRPTSNKPHKKLHTRQKDNPHQPMESYNKGRSNKKTLQEYTDTGGNNKSQGPKTPKTHRSFI